MPCYPSPPRGLEWHRRSDTGRCITRPRLQLGPFQRSFCWINIWQCLTGPARRVRWSPSEALRAENADWAPTLGPRREEGHPNLEPRRQEQCQDPAYRGERRHKANELHRVARGRPPPSNAWGLLGVTGGKTLSEYIFSELPQTADVVASVGSPSASVRPAPRWAPAATLCLDTATCIIMASDGCRNLNGGHPAASSPFRPSLGGSCARFRCRHGQAHHPA